MILEKEHRRELNDVQKKILHVLVATMAATGIQPSLAEIGIAVGLSTQAIHYQLREIDRAGWIDSSTGRSRGIDIAADVRAEMSAANLSDLEAERHG